MEGVAVESSAAPGARRRHGRPPFSERNRIVPDALTYHLRRLGSRLHRARITLQHVPEPQRPPQEPLLADYDPWQGYSGPQAYRRD